MCNGVSENRNSTYRERRILRGTYINRRQLVHFIKLPNLGNRLTPYSRKFHHGCQHIFSKILSEVELQRSSETKGKPHSISAIEKKRKSAERTHSNSHTLSFHQKRCLVGPFYINS
ncbi:hypothetical protein DsansV1_C01g0004051 [Dioscorea sansibarensis]